MSWLWRNLFSLGVALTWVAPTLAAEELQELQELLDRLLALPTVQTEADFTASVLVPPGSFYDPFDLQSHGATLWVSDDGKEEEDAGGRILAVDATATVSILAGLGALLPPIALDVAPPGFGAFVGHIFTVAFARPDAEAGFSVPNALQRIDPATGYGSHVCTLPENQAGQPGAGGFFLSQKKLGSFVKRRWL